VIALALTVLLAAPDPQARDRLGRVVALLEYVAADYTTAVGPKGELLSAAELAEQASFARDCASELRAAGSAEDLAGQLDALAAGIDRRDLPPAVVVAARRIGASIQQRFRLAVLPPRAPDKRRGERLYRQACAACHGRDGRPPEIGLPTRPPAFASKEAVRELAPQRIYRAVTYGVPGTAMPSFGDALDEAARWDLASYALALAHADQAERKRGLALLERAPRRPDYLQLAVRSDDQLRRALSASGLSQSDREAVLSAVRGP
jgi:high-affinity iron transporter